MKWLIIIVILAGLGYLGYMHKEELLAKYNSLRGGASAASGSSAHQFESKIEIPANSAGATPQPQQQHLAAPGVYYMVERVSATTSNGVAAINPGDEVKLLQKLPGDRMRVTNGATTMEIKNSQATNILEVAREAEKREFVARGGKL